MGEMERSRQKQKHHGGEREGEFGLRQWRWCGRPHTDLSDNKGARFIYVYSGVHGDPSGLLQVDEPDFSEKDEQELAQDDDDLTVVIRRMTLEDNARSIPRRLWNDVNEPDAHVVLAWCWSWFYFEMNNVELDSPTPPANSITVPPKDGQPMPLLGGRFALPARKIGGRRYRPRK
jgi:hypothetical protein